MNNPTTISATGIALVKQFEGCRLKAYLDSVNIPTIGYGHIKGVKMGDVITQAQADQWLAQELQDFSAGVTRCITVGVSQPQFDALVCFAYNVGLGALGKSTLLKKLNAGDVAGAADQFLVWDKAGGKAIAGLTRRRQAERQLFLVPPLVSSSAASV